MKHLQEISEYLKVKKCFIEQPDTFGRRYYFMHNGERVAYIWFKWALNGWRLAFLKEKNGEDWETRGPIESVTQLTAILRIDNEMKL
jgi:hypothetical protein